MHHKQFIQTTLRNSAFNGQMPSKETNFGSNGKRNRNSSKAVHVVVLGDVGHSPRMMNHCECILDAGARLNIVGFLESELSSSVLREKAVFYQLASFNSTFILLRVLLLVFQLLCYSSLHVKQGDILLVQNPPALPLLLVASLFRWCRRVKVAVDWHNFGHRLLAMKHGEKSVLVWLHKVLERALVRTVDVHYCVTYKMKRAIVRAFHINPNHVIVCYDKPKQSWGRTTIEEGAELFKKLQTNCPSIHYDYYFKNVLQSKLHINNRPYIAVCASSWSVDEDMQMLFDALKMYDRTDANSRIHVYITGKGPMRDGFVNSLVKFHFQKVKVYSLWLSYPDYRKLLGIADFGLSLHRSASGLDLPMKIVDYLGSGLAVFSIRYDCIHELVNVDNGFLFDDAQELAFLLTKHLDLPPGHNQLLHHLQDNAAKTIQERWEPYWKTTVQENLLTGVSICNA